MKKYYFKVYVDFTKYIPIDETELEKAIYAFQTGKPVIFENGAASRIESIIPDYNKGLGWYSDYKPNQDDNAELETIKPKYSGYVGLIKEKIQYLISKGKTELIGKNIEIPELSAPKENTLKKEIDGLLDKFTIH